MQKYIVSGRLTKDPVIKELKVGEETKKVANSSLAVRKIGKENETEFIELTFWNNGADYFAKNYHKGDAVIVYGIPSARAYQTQDGNVRATLCVTINEIERLSSGQPKEQVEAPAQEQTKLTPVDSGDLPF